jgi:hypothetical protein
LQKAQKALYKTHTRNFHLNATTLCTHSIESFGLKDVSVDAVEFPPTSGTSSIYTPCGHTNTTISVFNKSLVVQITKFLFVLSFAQQYALQEWQHRRCGNAILNSLQKYNRQKSYRVRGR